MTNFLHRNKELECAKALARAQRYASTCLYLIHSSLLNLTLYSIASTQSTDEGRKKKHREAQACYQAKRALESHSVDTMAPHAVELQKQKHREAQARYRQKNRDQIHLMRWAKTKEGLAFRLNMLAPVNDKDSACENINITLE